MVDESEKLDALLRLLWSSLNEAEPDKRASLAREYRQTLEKLETLKGKTKAGDPIDEVAARRAARRSGTA